MSATEPLAPPLPLTFLLVAPVNALMAVTDAGRAIPVFHYETVVLPSNPVETRLYQTDRAKLELLQRAERQFFINTKQDERNLTRKMSAVAACNCHGWIFLGGQYGIEDKHIPQVLSDNGYEEVAQPLAGDLGIVRKVADVSHSCLVRRHEEDAVIVESKWGPFGVFEHRAHAQPFGQNISFYRSHRTGHALPVRANPQ